MKSAKYSFLTWTLMVVLSACLSVPALAEKSVLEGTDADVYLESVDASGCVFTSAYLLAGERKFGIPSNTFRSKHVYLEIYKWSECGGGFEELVNAWGFIDLPGDSGAVTVQGHMGSASANATVEVYDSVSDSTFLVPVSLVWDGQGEVVRHRQVHTNQSPGSRTTLREMTLSRFATVQGSLLFEGTNLAAAPPEYASLSELKDASFSSGH
jgi:hypothetical protein